MHNLALACEAHIQLPSACGAHAQLPSACGAHIQLPSACGGVGGGETEVISHCDLIDPYAVLRCTLPVTHEGGSYERCHFYFPG